MASKHPHSVTGEKPVMYYYESIADQSKRMLDAARNADWDSLCAAEESCAHLIHEMQTLQMNAPLNEQERQKRMLILRQILREDAEVRDITEPWLRQLEDMLRTASASRKLDNSYGSES